MNAFTLTAQADGNSIDKVYHPYVHTLEKELEYRAIAQNDNKNNLDDEQKHRLGFRYSPSNLYYVELYALAEDKNNENFRLNAFEVESKIQLTEQGEYWADWGLLFELVKDKNQNTWNLANSVLFEKEFSDWIMTANLALEYEWGENIKDEVEGSLALQARYRLSRFLEPAVELYSNEDTLGIGPVLTGQVRLAPMKKLHWESGVIFGLRNKTPDATLRVLLEFSF
ncbi:MAG: hypothetical protein CVV13_12055 [Gammaproteobacteria bacterium HGW-Gammaproteobacteria-3]|nr:MAG: hypothetical protein CVV13_12055 [Gammaproteobacteria bacterium HGW-Gammaproteobacteria-3]